MTSVVNGFSTPPGPQQAESAAAIDVWSVLVDDEEVARRGLPLIPPTERRRLSLLAPLHRHRHICAHIAARVLASAALGGRAPAQTLIRTSGGRLALAAAPDTRFDISLAHAGASAAIAISRCGAVGVDLEPISPLIESEERRLARYSLAESEWTHWVRADPELRTRLLTQAWTRKEAVLKALGLGLSGDVRSVVTELEPIGSAAPDLARRPAEIRGLPAAAGHPLTWTMHDLPDEPGLLGSVAVRSANVELRYHRWAIADLLEHAGEIPAVVSAGNSVTSLP
jgi:4'-phosphopantetheinyl transferase